MPESRLQSDMLQNMTRAQLEAMMQRGQIAANQRRWMNYAQVRGGGAFYDGYGRPNPYLKYYVQMQRDAMEHQRRVSLQHMTMQRQMGVQQQQFDLRQEHEENQIQRTEDERKRKLLEVRKRREEIQNDPKFSPAQRAHYDKEAALEEAGLSDAPKLFTYTQEDSGYFYPDNYPVKDLRGKPIPNTIQLDNQTGVVEAGKEIYQDYFAQLKDDRADDLAREKERNSKDQKLAELRFKNIEEEKKAEEERVKNTILSDETEGFFMGDPEIPSESRGLGDTVAKITKATGIKKVTNTVFGVFNKDCGCRERQSKLNKLFPYKKEESDKRKTKGFFE